MNIYNFISMKSCIGINWILLCCMNNAIEMVYVIASSVLKKIYIPAKLQASKL